MTTKLTWRREWWERRGWRHRTPGSRTVRRRRRRRRTRTQRRRCCRNSASRSPRRPSSACWCRSTSAAAEAPHADHRSRIRYLSKKNREF